MNRDQTLQFLELLKASVPAQQVRTGWVVARCPLGPWRHAGGQDKNPSFAIRLEPGDAFCNCFSCGFHGVQSDLVLVMRAANRTAPVGVFPFGQAMQLIADAEDQIEIVIDCPDIAEVLYEAPTERFHEFPNWWLDSFPRWFESQVARDYLELREVPFEVANMLQLRFDTLQNRVCFPVRDFQGRLMGLHGRAVDGAVQPRYRMYTHAKNNNPLIWLGEHWVDPSRPIVVVEGPFDLASVYRVYRNVVSPLFSNPSIAKLRRMADALEWFTLFDRGVGGDAGRARVDKIMAGHLLHHLRPPKGANDPGEMSVEALVEVLGNCVALDAFLVA